MKKFISESLWDKFPIFLYYPTDQARYGLGLSLNYGIVKAIVGELTVETKDGEIRMSAHHFNWIDPDETETVFIIQRPIS